MWNDYLGLLFMAMLLRLDHELSRPRPGPAVRSKPEADRRVPLALAITVGLRPPEIGSDEIQPWQKRASEIASRRRVASEDDNERRARNGAEAQSGFRGDVNISQT